MDFELDKVSDYNLRDELDRRKNILNGDKDLSLVPLEYLISEFERRKNIPTVIYTSTEDEDVEILFNAFKTPDGTFLSSRSKHDYKSYQDTISKKIYTIDGGAHYLRRNGDMQDCEDLSIVKGMDFELIRNRFHWTNTGKNNDQPFKMMRLKELSNEHLINILKNLKFQKDSVFKDWFEKEIMYRVDHSIMIEY